MCLKHSRIGRFVIVGIIVATLGCGKNEEIHTYTVPKLKDRLLAGMTVHQGKAWFFKLAGPAQMVADQADDFRVFVESVQFSSDGRPTWELPPGWVEESGTDQTRHATIKTGETPGALKATIIPLQAPPGDITQYELANVNRWLGQLTLAPITADQLEQTVERLKLKAGQAIWLDATGTPGGAQMRAPFMAGNRPHPPIDGNNPIDGNDTEPAASKSAHGQPELLTFTKPTSWEPGRMSPMRKAAFVANDGEASVEITVIDLAASAGDPLANVNRWRGQVHLEPLDQPTLNEQLVEVSVDDVTGQYVEMFNPESVDLPQAILGVIVIRKERAWFFKLTGTASLAAIEKERFLEFVKSTKFTD